MKKRKLVGFRNKCEGEFFFLSFSERDRFERTNLLWLMWGEGVVREFGMGMYTLLYLKWVSNKDLLYSTWNSAQCYVAAWMGIL